MGARVGDRVGVGVGAFGTEGVFGTEGDVTSVSF